MLKQAMCKYQQSILQSNLSYVDLDARNFRVVCSVLAVLQMAKCVTPTSSRFTGSTVRIKHESLQITSQESSLMASRLLASKKR
jgi:hypothetical protein